MEAEVKKRNWHERNFPPRGTAVNAIVSEMGIDDETVVYIGPKQGAGFLWIGKYKDAPEQYRAMTVVETYDRTVDYPGIVLLVSDVTRNGQYWDWWEIDKSIPIPRSNQFTTEGVERLLIAMCRDEAHDYRNHLRSALKHVTEPDKARKAISKVKKFMLEDKRLAMLTGTSQGEYIIQRVEDDAYVCAVHRKVLDRLPYEKRYAIINKEIEEIQKQRIKSKEDEHYAHIKGRSVKH